MIPDEEIVGYRVLVTKEEFRRSLKEYGYPVCCLEFWVSESFEKGHSPSDLDSIYGPGDPSLKRIQCPECRANFQKNSN